MRAVFDTNVYISFLLAPTADRIPARLMEYGFRNHFELCVCGEQLSELVRAAASKPFLAERIDATDLETFATRLRREADFMDELPLATPGVVRDSNDDYLIAHAMVARADYLVTGDKDLLVLERIGELHIVTPAEFVFLLEMDGR
jgi:putative PIN family toxin of toxin-antitoxin system